MNNPRVNRAIMYAVLFPGFYVFWSGFHHSQGIRQILLLALSAVMIIGSFVWGLMKVRCPHCGKLLELKLYDISVCPHCGKDTCTD